MDKVNNSPSIALPDTLIHEIVNFFIRDIQEIEDFELTCQNEHILVDIDLRVDVSDLKIHGIIDWVARELVGSLEVDASVMVKVEEICLTSDKQYVKIRPMSKKINGKGLVGKPLIKVSNTILPIFADGHLLKFSLKDYIEVNSDIKDLIGLYPINKAVIQEGSLRLIPNI